VITDRKLVIFDCDGVLFDTADVNRIYYNRVLSHLNFPEMTDEQFAYVHMHTADESINYLFPHEAVEEAQAFRKTMPYAEFLKYMKPEPHMKPLLKKLRPRYKTAIATNRSDTMPRVMAEFDLDPYFDMVVTAFDVEKPKPHPDELIKILLHFNLLPEQAIYVGDSQVDEIASKAAGVPFVAYDNPELCADFYIQNLKEIEDILEI
jgi:HAD superfamily hydrolase (TIGR01509 family)